MGDSYALEHTLPSPANSAAPQVELEGDTLDERGFEARYRFVRLLGAGGMGEVKLSKDARIGREVAVKVLKPSVGSLSGSEARFLREARVQGQLEHPSVVPVYDLGKQADGTPYFTMKRVRGVTLEHVLTGLAAGDPELDKKYSRRKLLAAFTTACLTIDFAHTRGVLHRDLKPANIMLGEFGEVHVLDWGLAKIIGTPEGVEGAVRSGPADGSVEAGATVQGSMMGTPGYMSPEQAAGHITSLDVRTDIYALGAILFEILTLEPLHKGATVVERLASTVRGAKRPSERKPDAGIPPELDEICARATAQRAEDRFPSVRDLSDAVERFLDGDRDAELRRKLAEDHAAAAEAAEKREARPEAMREVTRALAFDPRHPRALEILGRLLAHVPTTIPPEAEKELAAIEEARKRRAAIFSIARFGGLVLLLPVFMAMGVKSWTPLIAMILLISGSALCSVAWLKRPSRGAMIGAYVLSTGVVACTSALFGPLMLAPAFAALNTALFGLKTDSRKIGSMAWLSPLAILVPLGLSWAGVLPPFYEIRSEGLTILPTGLWFAPRPTLGFLTFAGVAMSIGPTVASSRVRAALEESERRLFIHSWHLKQLVKW